MSWNLKQSFTHKDTHCFFIQVVPHITNAIKEWIQRVASIPVDGTDDSADVCVIELGGTVGKADSLLSIYFLQLLYNIPRTGPVNIFCVTFVGDIESMPFIEALRQLSFTVGMSNSLCWT